MARATRSSPVNLGGIDNALVVRVGSGSQSFVYVIPHSIVGQYVLGGLTAADQSRLDNFFASHTSPKVQAAMVTSIRIFDGADPLGADSVT
jgi:hypothetical protein